MHSAPVDLLKIQLSVGIDVCNGILEYAPHLFTYSFWSLAIRDTDCAEEEDATKLKVYFDRGLDVNSDEGMPKAFRNIKATRSTVLAGITCRSPAFIHCMLDMKADFDHKVRFFGITLGYI